MNTGLSAFRAGIENFIRLAALLLSVCLAFSCGGGDDIDMSDENTPTISLQNTVYLIAEPDQEPIRLKAEKMDIFVNSDIIDMSNVEFSQKLPDGTGDKIRGTAGRIHLNTKSQDASLSDGVEIFMHSDNGNDNRIVADDLDWGKYSKMIKSKGRVMLQYEKCVIDGEGFEGNISTARFTFNRIEQGTL